MRSPDRATALPGEEEPELSQTGLRRRGENPANRHRKATVTAPLLDSTQNPLFLDQRVINARFQQLSC